MLGVGWECTKNFVRYAIDWVGIDMITAAQLFFMRVIGLSCLHDTNTQTRSGLEHGSRQ
jgi:hypothetical protein